MASSTAIRAAAWAAKYLKKSLTPLYHQVGKIPSNMGIHVENYYSGGNLVKYTSSGKEFGAGVGRTIRGYADPFKIRSNEAFRSMGLSDTAVKNIEADLALKDAIKALPENYWYNWVDGKVGGTLKPLAQQRIGQVYKRQIKWGKNAGDFKNEMFTREAKTQLRALDKNIWGELYKDRAYLARKGITPKDPIFTQFFDDHMGKVYELQDFVKEQARLGISDDILGKMIKTWKFKNPQSLRVMEMYNKNLNSLAHDMQFDHNFRDLTRLINTDKLLSKGKVTTRGARRRIERKVAKKLTPLNRKLSVKEKIDIFLGNKKAPNVHGFTPKTLDDGSIYIQYSPSGKSNFYTGGINGMVVWNPKDPKHFRLVPSDAFDLFGNKAEMVAKNVFGMKNELLNVMGVQKIRIPDHTKWGKKIWQDRFKAIDKINDPIVRKNIMESAKPKKQRDISDLITGRTPEPVVGPKIVKDPAGLGNAINKGTLTDLNTMLDKIKTKDLPLERYGKQAFTTGIATAGVGGSVYGLTKLFPEGNKSNTTEKVQYDENRKLYASNSRRLFPVE